MVTCLLWSDWSVLTANSHTWFQISWSVRHGMMFHPSIQESRCPPEERQITLCSPCFYQWISCCFLLQFVMFVDVKTNTHTYMCTHDRLHVSITRPFSLLTVSLIQHLNKPHPTLSECDATALMHQMTSSDGRNRTSPASGEKNCTWTHHKHDLQLNNRWFFPHNLGPHVQRVRTHKKVAYALFHVND